MYISLILGFILFYSVHLLSFFTNKRSKLIEKYGERGFRLRYVAFALPGFVLMVSPFFLSNERSTPLYSDLYSFMNEIIFMALILLTAGNMPKSLTKKVFKHPMVLGYALWAFAHFLVISNVYGRYFFLLQWIFAISYYALLFYRDRKIVIDWNLKATIPNFFATVFMYFFIGFFHQYFTGKNIWRLIW